MQDIKSLAYNLTRKVKPLSSQALRKHMELSGWTIVPFSSSENEVLQLLNLSDFSIGKDSFAFRNAESSFIFIRTDKSEKETAILLLHEIGHIFCGHKLDTISVNDEQEASTFVDCCLKFSRFSWTRTLVIWGIACVILISGITIGIQYQQDTMRTDYNLPQSNIEVSITPTGTKYHSKNCRYVKDNPDVTVLLVDDAIKGGYSPCKVCQPNK